MNKMYKGIYIVEQQNGQDFQDCERKRRINCQGIIMTEVTVHARKVKTQKFHTRP